MTGGHLHQIPYGLIIEPCTKDEIRHRVTDFANFLLNPAQPAEGNDDEARQGFRARSSVPSAT